MGLRGSMGDRRVSYAAKALIRLAVKATSLKIPFLGVLPTLLVVVAAPILFRANMPSVAANSTLKCYDGGGNYEPCPTRPNASRSQFNGRPSTHQPLSWTTTALYQQTIWPTTSLGQQQQSMNQQIGQRARPLRAAVRQGNAQHWSPAGDVWYHASSPHCGGGLRRLHLLLWGRFDTPGNAFS